MTDESVDVPNQEVTEGDEFPCAQPLTQELPPMMVSPGPSMVTSPASKMAATDKEHVANAPKKKGKCKQPKAKIAPPHPFSMGLTYPYADQYGYWPGQGQHFQMTYQPQVPLMAASPGLSSWYTPPSVNVDMQGGASHTPRSFRRWVPNLK